jgi:ferredoxin
MVKIAQIEKCDGCGTCTDNCPTQILAVENGKISITDASLCTECANCKLSCPNKVLEMETK